MLSDAFPHQTPTHKSQLSSCCLGKLTQDPKSTGIKCATRGPTWKSTFEVGFLTGQVAVDRGGIILDLLYRGKCCLQQWIEAALRRNEQAKHAIAMLGIWEGLVENRPKGWWWLNLQELCSMNSLHSFRCQVTLSSISKLKFASK